MAGNVQLKLWQMWISSNLSSNTIVLNHLQITVTVLITNVIFLDPHLTSLPNQEKRTSGWSVTAKQTPPATPQVFSNARWTRPHWLPMRICSHWPEQVIAASQSACVTVDMQICYHLRRVTCYQTAEPKGYERQTRRKKTRKWSDGQDPYRVIGLTVKLLPVCSGSIKQDVCASGEEATALTCPSSLVIRKRLGLGTRGIPFIPRRKCNTTLFFFFLQLAWANVKPCHCGLSHWFNLKTGERLSTVGGRLLPSSAWFKKGICLLGATIMSGRGLQRLSAANVLRTLPQHCNYILPAYD